MSGAAKTGTREVQVLLKLDNLAIAKGVPTYLVRDVATGDCTLAIEIGQRWQPEMPFIGLAAALDLAQRVAAGDVRAITDPLSLKGLAVAVLAMAAAAAEGAGKQGLVL